MRYNYRGVIVESSLMLDSALFQPRDKKMDTEENKKPAGKKQPQKTGSRRRK